jgi:hypothetical protein
VLLPVLRIRDAHVTLDLLHRGHDEVDGGKLSDRLEPLRDDRRLHAALGALKVLRHEVAGSNVFGRFFKVGSGVGRRGRGARRRRRPSLFRVWRPAKDVDKKCLQQIWTDVRIAFVSHSLLPLQSDIKVSGVVHKYVLAAFALLAFAGLCWPF